LRWILATFFIAVFGSNPLAAQGSAPITADVKLVSDYRFRGISASSRGPALQANIDFATGAFVTGVWASTTSDYHGSHLETDWYAGGRYSYREVEFTLVGYAFIYPGSKRTTTFDVEGSVAAPLGNVKTSFLIAFSPAQRNNPKHNFYGSATLLLPLKGGRWSLIGHYGFETGNYDNKQDWKAAIRHERNGIGIELGFVGTNYSQQAGSDAGMGLVASIGAHF
jgi:uncharacterized protein (TIGR02001 family)